MCPPHEYVSVYVINIDLLSVSGENSINAGTVLSDMHAVCEEAGNYTK